MLGGFRCFLRPFVPPVSSAVTSFSGSARHRCCMPLLHLETLWPGDSLSSTVKPLASWSRQRFTETNVRAKLTYPPLSAVASS
eukprot:3913827-Amphidinium_carterae.1